MNTTRNFYPAILGIAALTLFTAGAMAQTQPNPFVPYPNPDGYHSAVRVLGQWQPIAVNPQIAYGPYYQLPFYGAFGAPLASRIIYLGYDRFPRNGYSIGYEFGFYPWNGYPTSNGDFQW